VQKHLPPIPIVAKNKKIRDTLRSMNFAATCPPTFPDAVIMFRKSAWKFPVKQIIKIGFTHGAYSFKRFPKAYYYNMFDVFFLTSDADMERMIKHGVTTGKVIGYPKTDSILDGSINQHNQKELADRIGLHPQKKTILFSATWDGSGMSAIDKWYDRLDALTPIYNILVTVHSWTSQAYLQPLKENKDIYFIDDYDILRYVMLADVCISDTTSLIAEFCLMDKPIITFRVPRTDRTMPDVLQMIESVSARIDTFDELEPAIKEALQSPNRLKPQRDAVVQTMVNPFDGKAGLRAAQEIVKLLPELKPVE
jgi:UDP-N-acetylglucosamine 2-epimerase